MKLFLLAIHSYSNLQLFPLNILCPHEGAIGGVTEEVCLKPGQRVRLPREGFLWLRLAEPLPSHLPPRAAYTSHLQYASSSQESLSDHATASAATVSALERIGPIPLRAQSPQVHGVGACATLVVSPHSVPASASRSSSSSSSYCGGNQIRLLRARSTVLVRNATDLPMRASLLAHATSTSPTWGCVLPPGDEAWVPVWAAASCLERGYLSFAPRHAVATAVATAAATDSSASAAAAASAVPTSQGSALSSGTPPSNVPAVAAVPARPATIDEELEEPFDAVSVPLAPPAPALQQPLPIRMGGCCGNGLGRSTAHNATSTAASEETEANDCSDGTADADATGLSTSVLHFHRRRRNSSSSSSSLLALHLGLAVVRDPVSVNASSEANSGAATTANALSYFRAAPNLMAFVLSAPFCVTNVLPRSIEVEVLARDSLSSFATSPTSSSGNNGPVVNRVSGFLLPGAKLPWHGCSHEHALEVKFRFAEASDSALGSNSGNNNRRSLWSSAVFVPPHSNRCDYSDALLFGQNNSSDDIPEKNGNHRWPHSGGSTEVQQVYLTETAAAAAAPAAPATRSESGALSVSAEVSQKGGLPGQVNVADASRAVTFYVPWWVRNGTGLELEVGSASSATGTATRRATEGDSPQILPFSPQDRSVLADSGVKSRAAAVGRSALRSSTGGFRDLLDASTTKYGNRSANNDTNTSSSSHSLLNDGGALWLVADPTAPPSPPPRQLLGLAPTSSLQPSAKHLCVRVRSCGVSSVDNAIDTSSYPAATANVVTAWSSPFALKDHRHRRRHHLSCLRLDALSLSPHTPAPALEFTGDVRQAPGLFGRYTQVLELQPRLSLVNNLGRSLQVAQAVGGLGPSSSTANLNEKHSPSSSGQFPVSSDSRRIYGQSSGLQHLLPRGLGMLTGDNTGRNLNGALGVAGSAGSGATLTLAAGACAPLHWSDGGGPRRIHIRFEEYGAQWSGQLDVSGTDLGLGGNYHDGDDDDDDVDNKSDSDDDTVDEIKLKGQGDLGSLSSKDAAVVTVLRLCNAHTHTVTFVHALVAQSRHSSALRVTLSPCPLDAVPFRIENATTHTIAHAQAKSTSGSVAWAQVRPTNTLLAFRSTPYAWDEPEMSMLPLSSSEHEKKIRSNRLKTNKLALSALIDERWIDLGTFAFASHGNHANSSGVGTGYNEEEDIFPVDSGAPPYLAVRRKGSVLALIDTRSCGTVNEHMGSPSSLQAVPKMVRASSISSSSARLDASAPDTTESEPTAPSQLHSRAPVSHVLTFPQPKVLLNQDHQPPYVRSLCVAVRLAGFGVSVVEHGYAFRDDRKVDTTSIPIDGGSGGGGKFSPRELLYLSVTEVTCAVDGGMLAKTNTGIRRSGSGVAPSALVQPQQTNSPLGEFLECVRFRIEGVQIDNMLPDTPFPNLLCLRDSSSVSAAVSSEEVLPFVDSSPKSPSVSSAKSAALMRDLTSECFDWVKDIWGDNQEASYHLHYSAPFLNVALLQSGRSISVDLAPMAVAVDGALVAALLDLGARLAPQLPSALSGAIAAAKAFTPPPSPPLQQRLLLLPSLSATDSSVSGLSRPAPAAAQQQPTSQQGAKSSQEGSRTTHVGSQAAPLIGALWPLREQIYRMQKFNHGSRGLLRQNSEGLLEISTLAPGISLNYSSSGNGSVIRSTQTINHQIRGDRSKKDRCNDEQTLESMLSQIESLHVSRIRLDLSFILGHGPRRLPERKEQLALTSGRNAPLPAEATVGLNSGGNAEEVASSLASTSKMAVADASDDNLVRSLLGLAYQHYGANPAATQGGGGVRKLLVAAVSAFGNTFASIDRAPLALQPLSLHGPKITPSEIARHYRGQSVRQVFMLLGTSVLVGAPLTAINKTIVRLGDLWREPRKVAGRLWRLDMKQWLKARVKGLKSLMIAMVHNLAYSAARTLHGFNQSLQYIYPSACDTHTWALSRSSTSSTSSSGSDRRTVYSSASTFTSSTTDTGADSSHMALQLLPRPITLPFGLHLAMRGLITEPWLLGVTARSPSGVIIGTCHALSGLVFKPLLGGFTQLEFTLGTLANATLPPQVCDNGGVGASMRVRPPRAFGALDGRLLAYTPATPLSPPGLNSYSTTTAASHSSAASGTSSGESGFKK